VQMRAAPPLVTDIDLKDIESVRMSSDSSLALTRLDGREPGKKN